MEQQQPETTPVPKRRLGRGLNALLGEQDEAAEGAENAPVETAQSYVDIELIERNPFQPRTEFEEAALEELAASIRQHGVLQPLLVRPHQGGYQLIAGERRLLASRRAGLKSVPCRVMELDDQHVCEVAIEENLKRADLNVLEKAKAFKEYLERFGSTIEQLAQQLSLDRSTVSNMLRLLDLPAPVQEALRADKIKNGHARALLPLEEADQIALCAKIQSDSLSVRQTEAAVRELLSGDQTVPFKKDKPAKLQPSNHLMSLQTKLQELLGVKVEIKPQGKDAGRIIFHFKSNDDFERILRHLRKAA